MNVSLPHRLTSVAALVLAGLLLLTGMAAAQPPGYGEGGPAASLSASASADSITVTGTGFVPGEPVTATVFSRPVDLGTKQADSFGSVTFTFSVRDLAPGEHRVVLDAPSGSATAYFTVLSPAAGSGGSASAQVDDNGSLSSGGLAYTGSDLIVPLSIAGGLLLLGGMAAAVGSRRRRERDTSAR